MSQMHGPEVRIKVSMDGDKPVHELWVGNENLGRVSFLWIVEAIMQFTNTLRFR